MDLNHLYFVQQCALMRAARAADALAHSRYQAAADRIARRIARFQHAAGAGIVSQEGVR
jgi:hypothetical protein